MVRDRPVMATADPTSSPRLPDLSVLFFSLVISLPVAVSGQETRADLPLPGPLRTLLAHPATARPPTAMVTTPSAPHPAPRAVPDLPPAHRPFLTGLAAKVLLDGAIVYMAGDVFHAFPALILVDPMVTAFGVYHGGGQLGSFPLDAVTSYGTLYLISSLAYGYNVGGGEFVEGESYHGLWVSMGVQLFATVLVDRHRARTMVDRARR